MLSSGTVISGNDASTVFDTAIKLAGIFHIIEWIKTTLLLTVICIGVNLMSVWYASAISGLYGIAVFFYMMSVMASDLGQACAVSQKTRYTWLIVEIVYFWVLFFIF